MIAVTFHSVKTLNSKTGDHKLEEINGHTQHDKNALTPDQQKIQDLEKQLWRAKRIMKS